MNALSGSPDLIVEAAVVRSTSQSRRQTLNMSPATQRPPGAPTSLPPTAAAAAATTAPHAAPQVIAKAIAAPRSPTAGTSTRTFEDDSGSVSSAGRSPAASAVRSHVPYVPPLELNKLADSTAHTRNVAAAVAAAAAIATADPMDVYGRDASPRSSSQSQLSDLALRNGVGLQAEDEGLPQQLSQQAKVELEQQQQLHHAQQEVEEATAAAAAYMQEQTVDRVARKQHLQDVQDKLRQLLQQQQQDDIASPSQLRRSAYPYGAFTMPARMSRTPARVAPASARSGSGRISTAENDTVERPLSSR